MARSIHDNKLQFSESAIFHDPQPRGPASDDQPIFTRLRRRQITRRGLGRTIGMRMVMADQPLAPCPFSPKRGEQGPRVDLERVLRARGDVDGGLGADDPT